MSSSASFEIAILKASHDSLRDDFQVTTKEMDGLVEILRKYLASPAGFA